MSSARFTRVCIICLLLLISLATISISGAAQESQPPHNFDKNRSREPFPPAPQGILQDVLTVRAQEITGIAQWSRIAYQSYRDGNWEIYFAMGDGSAAINLTKHTAADARPSINRGATRIAFNSNRDGNAEIYTMNVDGSGLKRLTSHTAADYAPTWSPDGKKIAFVSTRDGNPEIYSMNADGSGQTRLTFDPAEDTQPAWSPDGTKIAWGRYNNYYGSIYFMNPDGSGQRAFKSDLHFMGQVAWNPTGFVLIVDYDADNDFWNEIAVYIANDYYPTARYLVDSNEEFVDFWAGSWAPDAIWADFEGSFLLSRVEYTVIDDELYLQNAWIEKHDIGRSTNTRLPGAGLELAQNWQSGDIKPPSTRFINLQEYSPDSGFMLQWSAGETGLAAVTEYEVQYAIDQPDDWHPPFNNSPAESIWFQSDLAGHRLYLRARSRDEAYNQEPWPSSPAYDAYTTIYSWILSGRVVDNRGLSLPKVAVSVSPAALNSVVSSLTGTFKAWLGAEADRKFKAAHAGFGAFPDASIDGNHHTGLDLYLPPLDNLVNDGGFEAGGNSWIINNSPFTDTVVSQDQHTGSKSLRLGPPCQETCLTEPVSFEGYSYDLTTDLSGAVHVVYAANIGGESKLFYTTRPLDGTWSEPVNLVAVPAETAIYEISIVADGKGFLFAVWMDNYDLVYAFKPPTGTWSKPQKIGEGTRPSVAADPAGGFYLLYQDWQINNALYYRERLASGAWSSPVKLSDETNIGAADISVGPDRTAYIIYYETASETRGVYYRTRKPGEVVSPPVLVPGFIGKLISPNTIQVISTADGTLHTIFSTGSSYYRYLSPNKRWSETELLGMGVSDVVLSLTSSGKPYLYSETLYPWTTMIRYLNPDLSWSEPVRLTNTIYPKLAIGPGETIHLIYSGQFPYPGTSWLYQTTLHAVEEATYSASQVVQLNDSLNRPTLAFFYKTTEHPGSSPNTRFRVSIASGSSTVEVNSGLSGGKWSFVSVPMDEWAGKTVTTTFELEQAAGEPIIQVYLDDVSLGSWLTPSIASVSPSEIGTGWAGKVITIQGENFIGTPSVYLDNTALNNVQWVDENSLQATLPPGLGPGLYSLLVKNPGGQENALSWSFRLGSSIFLPTIQR